MLTDIFEDEYYPTIWKSILSIVISVLLFPVAILFIVVLYLLGYVRFIEEDLQFRWVSKRINKMRKPRVLDVGAGDKYLNCLLKNTIKYDSLDIKQEQTYNYDLEKPLPIRKKYDVIVLMDILEHCTNPDAIIKEMKRISHKNTSFFIALPNEYSWLFRIYHLFGHTTKMDTCFQIVNQHLHIHRPRVKDIKEFCSKHLKVKEITYLWYSDSFPEWFNIIMNRLAKVYPSLFAKEVVVWGKKK